MPGTTSRTKRRRRRWARGPAAQKSQEPVPCPAASSATGTGTASTATTTVTTTVSTTISASTVVTASQRKRSLSPYASFHDDSGASSSESESDMDVFEGEGCRLFELGRLQTVLQQLSYGECGEKGIVYREDFTKRQGLYTASYLFCKECSCRIPIPFSSVSKRRVLAVNWKAVFANKCAGGSLASLKKLCGMLDLPMPVLKNVYTTHVQAISTGHPVGTSKHETSEGRSSWIVWSKR